MGRIVISCGFKANKLDLLNYAYARFLGFNSDQMKYTKPNIPNIRNRTAKNEQTKSKKLKELKVIICLKLTKTESTNPHLPNSSEVWILIIPKPICYL